MDNDTRLIELALSKAKAERKEFLAYLLEMALLEARQLLIRQSQNETA